MSCLTSCAVCLFLYECERETVKSITSMSLCFFGGGCVFGGVACCSSLLTNSFVCWPEANRIQIKFHTHHTKLSGELISWLYSQHRCYKCHMNATKHASARLLATTKLFFERPTECSLKESEVQFLFFFKWSAVVPLMHCLVSLCWCLRWHKLLQWFSYEPLSTTANNSSQRLWIKSGSGIDLAMFHSG